MIPSSEEESREILKNLDRTRLANSRDVKERVFLCGDRAQRAIILNFSAPKDENGVSEADIAYLIADETLSGLDSVSQRMVLAQILQFFGMK